jgi:hypothetical protein
MASHLRTDTGRYGDKVVSIVNRVREKQLRDCGAISGRDQRFFSIPKCPD